MSVGRFLSEKVPPLRTSALSFWRSRRAQLRSVRLRDVPAQLHALVTPVRVLYAVVFWLFLWLLRTSIPASQESLQKYYCFGPAMSPFEIDANTYSEWHRGAPSPVKFNNHLPVDVSNTSSIRHTDLNLVSTSTSPADNGERVLILTPVRDASTYLNKYFDLLAALSYPHSLIDLGFLVSDSGDETMAVLASELSRVQNGPKPFRSVEIYSKNFGVKLDNLNVEERHAYAQQAPRRIAMARARNYLLASALKPHHAWVMWRDVDIIESPKGIVEDLMQHDTDVVVPNIWFHRYVDGTDIEGRFDYNSWRDTDKSRALLRTLHPDTVVVEGYKEFDTGRDYMATKGDWRRDPHEEMDLDGVGGVNILVKADVHRTGINFPAYAFENQAETEGFAKMAKRAGYRVVGLPNYVVWHFDTAEADRKD